MANRPARCLPVALLAAWACTSTTDREAVPGPAQPLSAAAPPTTPAQAPDAAPATDPPPAAADSPATDAERLMLSDDTTGVLVAKDYVPLSDHERQRLRLGAARRNPRAHIELEGRRSARGLEHGMAVAMRTENDDLPAFYGETVRTSLTILAQMAREEFGKVDAAATVRTEPDDAGRHIDMFVTVNGAGFGQMRLHSRHWAVPAGVVYEVGCQCAGPGCAFGHEGCILPEPPADALELDTPIDGGKAASTLTIADGLGRTEVAPFFTDLGAEELASMAKAARENDARIARIDVQARVGPRDDTGIVALTDATWCRKAKDGCTTDGIVKASRDAQVSGAVLEGFEPTVSTSKKVVNGVSYDSYEMRVGLLSWERHLFWQDGASVRELSCTCGGPACAVVERTCALMPPTQR